MALFTARKKIAPVERPEYGDSNEKDVSSELRRRYQEWWGADNEFLRRAATELDFKSGLHWIEEETGLDRATAMRDINRSAFSIDLVTPSVDIVVNQVRINKLTPIFVPESHGANDATAEVRSGIYRNIDRVSMAPIARETAYDFAVSVGRGYWRIIIEDEEGATFAQRIGIQRVDNLNSIAVDPTCLSFTYSDMGWAYCFDDLYKDQFREQYGRDDKQLDFTGMDIAEDTRAVWFPKDKVRVGEYFRKVWKKRTVWELQDGSAVWMDEAPPGAVPVREKEKPDWHIEWRKMTGSQTLEKRVWPGRYIPIVVCIGREVFRGKKPKIHSGLVRPAMHPSIIYDYMESRKVDEVGLSPLPHFLAYTGQLSPEQKQIVNNINSKPWSVVEVTPKEDKSGRQLPLAGWVSPSPNIVAVVQAADSAKDDLQRVLNVYAPQRGQPQMGLSGVAQREAKDSGDLSHASYSDNYNRALNMEAVIVNDLMDYVYTDKQAITITQPDDKTEQVLINQEYQDPKSGQIKLHLFGAGHKYGVSVALQPSYTMKLAESAQRILELAKTFPPEMAKTLDLIVQDLSIPGSRKYVERLRPLGFKDDNEMPSQTQLMQELQQSEANSKQADSLISQLMQKVQELGNAEAIKRLEIASKEKIAAASDRAGIIEAEIKAGQAADHAVLMAKLEVILRALEAGQDTNTGLTQPIMPPPGEGEPPTGGAPPAATAPSPIPPMAPPQSTNGPAQ